MNLVDAEAAAELDQYFKASAVGLPRAVRAFYSLFGDDYDFLVFVADHDTGASIRGRSSVVRSPAILGTGIDVPMLRTD